MDIGNIIAVLLPLPLGILWLGAAIPVAFTNLRHPHPKVRNYTRRAAFRLFGLAVVMLPVAIFFPGEGMNHWFVTWGIAALVMIPWSLWSLVNIRDDRWDNVDLSAKETADV